MAKFTGKGAQFLTDTGTTTPTYVPIGQVQEIGDIAVTAEEVDVTTLDAGDYRDYIQGFKDPGECELTVLFDPALASQGDGANGLIGLFNSGETKDCAIRYNSSATGGQEFALFKAFIRDMTYGALNADDPQTITPLFRLTTPIVLADALPSTTQEIDALGVRLAAAGRVPEAADAPEAAVKAPSQTGQGPIVLNPLSASVPASGYSGSFSVMTTPRVSWNAKSGAPWMFVTAPAGQLAGNGTVSYLVEAQPAGAGPRTGYITVDGQAFTVTQEAS